MAKPDSFINLAKGFVDPADTDHPRCASADFITRQTFVFYDSVVAFRKSEVFRKRPPQIGGDLSHP